MSSLSSKKFTTEKSSVAYREICENNHKYIYISDQELVSPSYGKIVSAVNKTLVAKTKISITGPVKLQIPTHTINPQITTQGAHLNLGEDRTGL